MPIDPGLGRTVMELSTDSAKFFTDLDKVDRRAKDLGKTFDKVADQLKSVEQGIQSTGQKSAASTELIGKAFEQTEGHVRHLVEATKQFAGSDVIAKAQNYLQVIETIGGVSKLTALEQAKVATVVGQALEKYRLLGQEAPRDLQDIFAATQKLIGPSSSLENHLEQIQRHVATFSGDRVIQEATQMARAVEEVGGASKLTAVEQARVNAAVTDAIHKYEALGREAPTHLKKIQAETRETVTWGQKIGDVFKSGFAQMTGAFTVATMIDRAVTSLVSFVGEAIKAAGATVDLANKTNLSIKAIQQFQFVAPQSGVSIDTLTDSVFKLQTIIAEGKKSARAAVQDLRLDFDHLKASKPEDAFNEVMAALERMPAGFERNLAMQRLFGKGAKEVAKLVADGYTQMKDAASVSSDEQIKALDAAGDAWERFKDRIQKQTISILGSYVLQREQVDSLTAAEMAQFQAVIRSGGDAAKVLAEIAHARELAAARKDTNLPIPGPKTDPLDAYRKKLQDIKDDLAALTTEQKKAIAEGVRLGQSARDITEDLKALGLELNEDSVANYVEHLKQVETQVKKDNQWLTQFRESAKQLDAQLGMIFDAFKGRTVPIEVLKDLEGQMEKTVDMSFLLGHEIGENLPRAIKQLRQAQLHEAIEQLNRDFTLLFEKMRGKNADIQPLKQSVEDAIKDIRRTIGAVEPEAIQLQQRLVATQRDSLAKRLDLINLEYDAQVASLDKQGAYYKEHLQVLAAERRKALDDATREWHEQALTVRKVLIDAVTDLPGIIAQNLDRGGWTAVGAAIAEQIAAGLTAHFLDLLKKNPAISPKDLKRMQTAIGVGTAGGSAAGGLIGGGTGSQIGGLASSVGGTALAASGVVTGTVALAAATAGIGAAAAGIYMGIRQILKNNAEWVKLGKGLGRDLGVAVSEGLLKQMEADAKKFGREEATLLHLPEIIDEAGGVKEFGIDLAIRKTHDLFSMLARGDLTAKQVGTTFNKLFAQILPEAIDKTTGVASAQFRELITLSKDFGIQSEAVTEFVTQQSQAAATGLQQFLQNATFQTAQGAEAAGDLVAGVFAELRGSMSAREALSQLGPIIADIRAQLEKTGFSGGAAFDEIARLAGIAGNEISGKALAAIDGLSSALVGATNAGFINEKMFQGLTAEIIANRQAIIDQGASSEDVNLLMQKDLQRIWELQHDLGYAVDETTQTILDQAEAQGLVGEKFRSATDRMVAALEHIADKFDELTGSTERFTDRLKRIPRNVDVDVNVREKHGRSDAPITEDDLNRVPDFYPTGAATGGRVTRRGIIPFMPQPVLPAYLNRGSVGGQLVRFIPKGTDVVPAMLTPDERVLTPEQYENANKVIASALRGMHVAERTVAAMHDMLADTGTDGRGEARPIQLHVHQNFDGATIYDIDGLVQRSVPALKKAIQNDVGGLRTHLESVLK